MLRLLLPFLAGIVLSLSLQATRIISPVLWITILILTLATGFIKTEKTKQIFKWLFGVFLSGFLFICGYNSVLFHKEILQPSHFKNIQDKGIYFAYISEPLQEKSNSFKSILQIKAIKHGNSIIPAKGRVLVYFEKDSSNIALSEGCLIVLSGTMSEIGQPQNPGAFDYRKYMASNNVYHQIYLKNGTWKIILQPKGFSLKRTAHRISDSFIQILKNNGLSGREFSVASALLLGQKDMLDNETRQMYSGSGVMHILCVSGLHVGVIYIIINFILGFIKRGRLFIFKIALILVTIWSYSILTGLSPSVLRAAAMFTFITIGNASKRNVHIINSLAVSALFLLLIDPLMISNIGFQLSYIAILGIVFINNLIANLWHPTNRILEYLWSLIAVSIAAQIATAPLALLYFHQFPSYFILANLIAIPLSFLAIYAGVGVIVFSFIPAISGILGIITNYLLLALNSTVEFIDKLPQSVLLTNRIFIPEMLLIYALIISILLFLNYRKKELIFLILITLLAFSTSISFTEYKRQKQKMIVFYSCGKHSSIGFISGKRQVLMADSALIMDKKINKYQLEGSKFLFGITEMNSFVLDSINKSSNRISLSQQPIHFLKSNYIFQDKRIAIVDKMNSKELFTRSKLKVDYLIIRNNPGLKIKKLLDLYTPEIVIIDGTNSIYKTDKWLDECRLAGIRSYSTRYSGALVVKL